MQGYVHVYTGDGKGKTTAALGLALRAVGAGFKVYIGQFIKLGDYSEIKALQRFAPQITIRQFGPGRFIKACPSEEEQQTARASLDEVKNALTSGQYDLVVDEANVATACGLIQEQDLIDLIDIRPPQVELVFTGHSVPAKVRARADLITEMQAVKHYFEQGVSARKGIEN